MAHQVVQIVLRCESAAETEHLGNKTMSNFLNIKNGNKKKTNKQTSFVIQLLSTKLVCTLKSVDD